MCREEWRSPGKCFASVYMKEMSIPRMSPQGLNQNEGWPQHVGPGLLFRNDWEPFGISFVSFQIIISVLYYFSRSYCSMFLFAVLYILTLVFMKQWWCGMSLAANDANPYRKVRNSSLAIPSTNSRKKKKKKKLSSFSLWWLVLH
jgi:hypothetical protein